jgi:hypothetical protein
MLIEGDSDPILGMPRENATFKYGDQQLLSKTAVMNPARVHQSTNGREQCVSFAQRLTGIVAETPSARVIFRPFVYRLC